MNAAFAPLYYIIRQMGIIMKHVLDVYNRRISDQACFCQCNGVSKQRGKPRLQYTVCDTVSIPKLYPRIQMFALCISNVHKCNYDFIIVMCKPHVNCYNGYVLSCSMQWIHASSLFVHFFYQYYHWISVYSVNIRACGFYSSKAQIEGFDFNYSIFY